MIYLYLGWKIFIQKYTDETRNSFRNNHVFGKNWNDEARFKIKRVYSARISLKRWLTNGPSRLQDKS